MKAILSVIVVPCLSNLDSGALISPTVPCSSRYLDLMQCLAIGISPWLRFLVLTNHGGDSITIKISLSSHFCVTQPSPKYCNSYKGLGLCLKHIEKFHYYLDPSIYDERIWAVSKLNCFYLVGSGQSCLLVICYAISENLQRDAPRKMRLLGSTAMITV